MPPGLRSQGPAVQKIPGDQDQDLETTPRPSDGDHDAPVSVVTLASLDMDEELRIMLESAQSPDVLPLVYLDLRERLDQALETMLASDGFRSCIRPLLAHGTQAQELSLGVKNQTEKLRELVQDLLRNTSQEASAQGAEIRALRDRLQEITESMLNPDSMKDRIVSLTSALQENQDQVNQVKTEVQGLRELTNTLTTENTLLRGRLRNLENSRPRLRPSGTHERDLERVSVARSPIVESASRAVPPLATPAIMPPTRDQGRQDSRMSPPTLEEFMTGVRAPVTARSPQAYGASGPDRNPLKPPGLASLATCDRPTPLPHEHHVNQGHQVQEGPYCPGLVPHVPMLTPFKIVASYRHYRLKDTRATLYEGKSEALYRVKRRFDSLYPTFQVFDGKLPVKLLEFLSTLRKGFDALRVSEALGVLALAYYLDGAAKTHYTALTSPGVRTLNSTLATTWPFLVDSLLKRYLTDDTLQAAYEKITDAKQGPDEDENTFADRLISAARDCCNVFDDRELVNHCIRGLLPSTRDAVTERVRQLPTQDQGDITVARRVAQAEDNKYRARRAVAPATPRPKPKPKAMLITDEQEPAMPSLAPTPSPWRRDTNLPHLFGGPEALRAQVGRENPELAFRVAQNLESLLFVGANQDPKKPVMSPVSPTSSTSLDKLINRAHVEVPKLTDAQYRDALTVIPADYWNLNCWTCKTDGHTTFTCPSLTAEQRLYFAYCYFLYQCKSHPAMKDWLRERYAKRAIKAQERAVARRSPLPDQATRGPPRPRSPGGGPKQGRPYQNRVERNNGKNVRFAKQGVFITTHVGDAPLASPWQEKHDSDSSGSGNDKGQE